MAEAGSTVRFALAVGAILPELLYRTISSAERERLTTSR